MMTLPAVSPIQMLSVDTLLKVKIEPKENGLKG